VKNFIRRSLSMFVAATIALGAQIVAPALLPNSDTASASAAELTGLTPNMVLLTSLLDDSFRVQINNYDPAYTWDVAVTYPTPFTITTRAPQPGSTIYLITVRGLAYDDSATLSVTTSRAGYASVTSSIVGYSNRTPVKPTFGPVIPVFYGYSVQITNYDPAYSYAVVSQRGRATINSTGLVTVTSISDSGADVLYVTPTRTGYLTRLTSTDAAADPIRDALVPTFETVSQELNTVTVQITNFDPAFTWTVDYASDGTATIDENGLTTVTDLYAGSPVVIYVSATRYGYRTGQAQYEFVSTSEAVIPESTDYTPLNSGFTAQIVNYDAALDWSVTTDAGTATIDSNGLITVSGLTHGQSARITVSTTQANREPGNTVLIGRALYRALVPVVGPSTPTADGYTMQIENFDPAFRWYITNPDNIGYSRIDNGGLIITVGLSAGQTASYQLFSSQSGYQDGQITIRGSAIAPVQTPAGSSTSQSIDSTDSVDSDDSRDTDGLAEIAAQYASKIRAITEDAIREKAEAKAALEAKLAAVAAEKLASDLKAIASLLTSTKNVPTSSIKSLTPSQMALIPINTFRRLSPIAVNSITPSQASALTPGQVRSLNVKSLIKLTPVAIGALKPETLGSLSVAKLKALTKAQVRAIWAAQLLQLDSSQRKAISR
jgi:hypothetical protein